MKAGRISQAGKYDDILASGSDLIELVGAHEKALATLDSVQTIITRPSSSTKEEKDVPKTSQLEDDGRVEQLVQEEERAKGRVGFTELSIPFILFAHISFQITLVGSNYWMAWATPVSADDDKPPAVDATTLIGVFVAFSLGGGVFILLRETLLSTFAYKTATLFFDQMHSCIFRAPMAFFDATPSGRVQNRVAWQVFVIFIPIACFCLYYQQHAN